MSKEINHLYGALHNTLDKLKGVVRKGKVIPSAEEIYEWFITISPIEIKTNRPPIISSNTKADNFEAIFFFNSMRVYLSLKYNPMEYRGNPFIAFTTEIHFIDELDPDDYMDAKVIEHLQKNFHGFTASNWNPKP